MFYKLIDGKIKSCPQNGILNDGTAISNLPKFFENNIEIANENGFYVLDELEPTAQPIGYKLENNTIKAVYESEEA